MPRRLLKIAALALVLLTAVGSLTAWVMRGKIADTMLDIAEARLAEGGIHIHRGSYGYSVQRGVILKDVELFSDKDGKTRLARFDQLGIRIPWMELSQRNATLHLSMRDSGITLESSAGQLRLAHVNCSLTFTHGSLAIDHLDSRLRNLRVSATGLLNWQEDEARKAFTLPDPAPLVKAVSWLDFPQGSPTLALDISNSRQAGMALKGALTGSRLTWRKMKFDRADVRVVFADGSVEIPSLDVDCYGGNLKAALTVDPAAGLLNVRKLASSVDPFRFSEAVMGTDSLESCRTLGTTTLEGSKLVFNLRDFSRSIGNLKADSTAGMAISIGRVEVEMREFHGSLKFAEGRLVVEGDKFECFGGSGKGTYAMPLGGNHTYQLQVRCDGMSMEQMGQKPGLKAPITGKMNASFEGGGASGMMSHSGKGRIEIRGGDFYSVPLFGSLRAMLTRQSAKFGEDQASDLNCSYALKDGIVSSQDLRINSSATKLLASGQVDLVHQTLDADARANLRGVAGIATEVFSRILELHGEGPLDDVRWRMANAPGIVRGAAEGTVDGVKTAIEGAGKVMEGVGGTATKAIERRPGLLIPNSRPSQK